jgi:hypothetical protein
VSWPWRSPEATRRALTDRVRARYPLNERQRRLREIAYRRLLLRLFETQPDRWVVKGGASLLLRLDPNRTSNDIDLAYVASAGEHVLAVKALEEALAHDAGDFFSFELAAGRMVDADHPLERAYSVGVVARVGGTVFAEFSVDLGLPREDLDVEVIEATPALTGEPSVDALPPIATLTFPAQVADKVCAVFERHGESRAYSSRARDVADIAMIAAQIDLDGSGLIERLRTEEQRRLAAGTLDGPLPDRLALEAAQREDWKGRWEKATRGAPIGFEDALSTASKLVDPLLSGAAAGARWYPAPQRWR